MVEYIFHDQKDRFVTHTGNDFEFVIQPVDDLRGEVFIYFLRTGVSFPAKEFRLRFAFRGWKRGEVGFTDR